MGNFAAAEDAYRAALALQERVLGRDNPDTVTALVHLALNLANQGRGQEAEACSPAPRRSWTVPPIRSPHARLAHYHGLAALLDGQADRRADALLREAETRYAALVPRSMLEGTAAGAALIADPAAVSAVLGLSEVRRYLARSLAQGDDPAAATGMIADSRRLLRLTGLESGLLIARSADRGGRLGLARA